MRRVGWRIIPFIALTSTTVREEILIKIMYYLSCCVTRTVYSDKMRDAVMISVIVSIVCAGNHLNLRKYIYAFIYIHTQTPEQMGTSRHTIIMFSISYTCLLFYFFYSFIRLSASVMAMTCRLWC